MPSVLHAFEQSPVFGAEKLNMNQEKSHLMAWHASHVHGILEQAIHVTHVVQLATD